MPGESEEFLEKMRYYYSKATEMMSTSIAAREIGVPIEDIEEAVEMHAKGLLKRDTSIIEDHVDV